MQKKYYYGKNTQEQLLETEARLVYAADSIDEHDWKALCTLTTSAKFSM